MRMLWVAEGTGAALLLLLPYYSLYLLPGHLTLYHHVFPVTTILWGLILDIALFAALFAIFIAVVERLAGAPKRILESLSAGFMLWSFVDFALQALLHQGHSVSGLYRICGACAFPSLIFFGILGFFLPATARFGVRLVRVSLAALSVSVIWIVPQLLHLAVLNQSGDRVTLVDTASQKRAAPEPRIVWILFDELSYAQVFERSDAGVSLENFKRLRTRSVTFSQLNPAGSSTDTIVPSLLTGERILQIRSNKEGLLWYRASNQAEWHRFEQSATLFGAAHQLGWTSGVVGWYNPYCRILAGVLDSCWWETPKQLIELAGASETKSPWSNAAVMPEAISSNLVFHGKRAAQRQEHLETYQRLLEHSLELIRADSARLVFLHLAVPHPPGVYDRVRHTLTPSGTYLDNLVLADDTLGKLLAAIAETKSAAATTVIVSSDHSWRTEIWNASENWSEEEQNASGGNFDPRPVLLVHFPAQNTGENIAAETPELILHGILEGMLTGSIGNPEDIVRYAMERKYLPPT